MTRIKNNIDHNLEVNEDNNRNDNERYYDNTIGIQSIIYDLGDYNHLSCHPMIDR